MPIEENANPQSEEITRSPLHPLTRSPLFWLAAFFVLNLAVPFLSIPSRATALIGVLALTFSYVCIVVFFALGVAQKKFTIPQILAWAIFALVVWLALDNFIRPIVIRMIRHSLQVTGTVPAEFSFVLVGLKVLVSTALMSFSICVGNFASRLIRTQNMLGPICIIIALVDIWGVLFGGIVSQLMAKAPQIAVKAMTAGPRIGAASGSKYAIAIPDIGVGDYLFIGLLFGALVWLGLNWRDAIKWVVPLVSIALLAIVLVPWVPPLPGLLFIGLGVAIPNRDTFQYTREEKFALLYAGVFVAILTGVLYLGFKSALPPDQPRAHQTSRNSS